MSCNKEQHGPKQATQIKAKQKCLTAPSGLFPAKLKATVNEVSQRKTPT